MILLASAMILNTWCMFFFVLLNISKHSLHFTLDEISVQNFSGPVGLYSCCRSKASHPNCEQHNELVSVSTEGAGIAEKRHLMA